MSASPTPRSATASSRNGGAATPTPKRQRGSEVVRFRIGNVVRLSVEPRQNEESFKVMLLDDTGTLVLVRKSVSETLRWECVCCSQIRSEYSIQAGHSPDWMVLDPLPNVAVDDLKKPTDEFWVKVEDSHHQLTGTFGDVEHLAFAWNIVRHGRGLLSKDDDAMDERASGGDDIQLKAHKAHFELLRQIIKSFANLKHTESEELYQIGFGHLVRITEFELPLNQKRNLLKVRESYDQIIARLNPLWLYLGLDSLEDEEEPEEGFGHPRDDEEYMDFSQKSLDKKLEEIQEADDRDPSGNVVGYEEEEPEKQPEEVPELDIPENSPDALKRLLDLLNRAHLTKLRDAIKVFDSQAMLSRLLEHFADYDNPETNEMFAGGSTQLGKTSLKCLAALAACCANVVPIVITPGSVNAKSLAVKFNEFLGKDKVKDEEVPAVITLSKLNDERFDIPPGIWRKTLTDEAFSLEHDTSKIPPPIVVLNYNFRHLEVIRKFRDDSTTPHRRIAVILDEADEIFKSPAGQVVGILKQELMLLRLLGRYEDFPQVDPSDPPIYFKPEIIEKPRLLMHVSATLLPCLIELCYRDFKREAEDCSLAAEDFIFLDPTKNANYVGLDDAQRWTDEENDDLRVGDLTDTNYFLNDALEAFYADAFKYPDSLVVDLTSTRVRALGGMFDKLRTKLRTKFGPFLGMCQTGRGVAYIDTRDRNVEAITEDYDKKQVGEKPKKESLVEVITRKFEEDSTVRPIVFLGGTLVYRGISVRNDTRVPTHVVVCLSNSNSIDRVIQAAGRGTGLMRDRIGELEAGKAAGVKVKMLLPQADWDQIKIYKLTLDEICQQLNDPAAMDPSYKRLERALEEAGWNAETMIRPVGMKRRGNGARLAEMFPHICVPKIESDDRLDQYSLTKLKAVAKQCFVATYEDESRSVIMERLQNRRSARDESPKDRELYDFGSAPTPSLLGV